MLPMICLSEHHPQEAVLHPQYMGLVSTAVLDRAISLYQFLEGFLLPTESRDTIGQRLIRENYRAILVER